MDELLYALIGTWTWQDADFSRLRNLACYEQTDLWVAYVTNRDCRAYFGAWDAPGMDNKHSIRVSFILSESFGYGR